MGIYALIVIAKLWQIIRSDRRSSIVTNSILDRFATIGIIEIVICLIVTPIAIYSLLWIPHLIQNPIPNFIDVVEETAQDFRCSQPVRIIFSRKVEEGRSVKTYFDVNLLDK